MDTPHNSIGHELDAGDVRGIAVAGIGISAGVAMVLLMVYGMFFFLAHHPLETWPANPMARTNEQQFPPAPRITDHPTEELLKLHSEEDRVLSTYGWVDKKAGIVRIPIDQAMDLQLQRGFPVRGEVVKK